MRALALLLPLLLPMTAAASDFSCRNIDVEVSCAKGECEVKPKGEFTPQSLNLRGNALSICAYSRCYSGDVIVRHTRDKLTFLQTIVMSDTPASPGPERLAIIHDPLDRVALVRFMGFAHTMSCT